MDLATSEASACEFGFTMTVLKHLLCHAFGQDKLFHSIEDSGIRGNV
jgi:hypothetical protein